MTTPTLISEAHTTANTDGLSLTADTINGDLLLVVMANTEFSAGSLHTPTVQLKCGGTGTVTTEDELTLTTALVSTLGTTANDVSLASCTTVSGSALVAFTGASPSIGMLVSGTGIQTNSRVISLNPGISFTLSKTASANGTVTLAAGFIKPDLMTGDDTNGWTFQWSVKITGTTATAANITAAVNWGGTSTTRRVQVTAWNPQGGTIPSRSARVSAAYDDSGKRTATGNTTNGSTNVPCTSAQSSDLYMSIKQANIPVSTYITAVNVGVGFTISNAATGPGTGVTLTIGAGTATGRINVIKRSGTIPTDRKLLLSGQAMANAGTSTGPVIDVDFDGTFETTATTGVDGAFQRLWVATNQQNFFYAAPYDVGASNLPASLFFQINYANTPAAAHQLAAVLYALTTALLNETISESGSTSDSVARVLAEIRSLTESLTTTDAAVQIRTFPVALAETTTTTDSVTRVTLQPRALTETMSTIDALVISGVGNVPVAETIPTVDSVTAPQSAARAVVESLSTSDSVTRGLSANLTETIPTTDVVTNALPPLEPDTGGGTWTGGSGELGELGGVLNETHVTTDSVGVVRAPITKTLAESLLTIDLVAASGGGVQFLTESLTTTDGFAAHSVAADREVTETLTTTDSAVGVEGLMVGLAEMLVTTDDVVTEAVVAPLFRVGVPIAYIDKQRIAYAEV